MADTKITALTEDTTPTSDDLVVTVNDPSGTPANRKVSAANLITKAHGLSDGLVKVATGTMAAATAGTDYSTPSSTDTLTNKTFDANGTGNSLSNVEVADMAATAVVTAAEGLASSDNDTSLPTTAAVIDGLATKADSSHTHAQSDITNLVSDLAAKQPLDADLTTIAGLTATSDNFIQAKSSAWASRTPTQVTADLINFVGDSGAGGTKGLVPAPAAGDAAASKYLKADGTWATVSASGGQSTYDAIVAASGGDYTTLGAAIAAASSGWSIFVKEGTYTESAITTALNNLTIVGEHPETTILSLTTVAASFSGTNITFRNIGFTASTGYLHLTGDEARLEQVHFDATSNASSTASIYLTGSRSIVSQCIFNSTVNTGTPTVNFFQTSGQDTIISATYMKAPARATSNSLGGIRIAGTNTKVVGCQFSSTSDVASGILMAVSGRATVITGNMFLNQNNSVAGIMLYVTNNRVTVSGNTIYAQVYISNAINFTGNYVYCPIPSASAVYINNSGPVSVTNNYLEGNTGAGNVGITVPNAINNAHIAGNEIYTFETGISIGTGSNIYAKSNYINNCTTAITDNSVGSELENMGSNQNNRKEMIYMKNTSGGALAAGDVVVLKAVAAGDEVTTTTTAGDDKVYGMVTAAHANNAYGYIQTLGKTTALKVNGTTDIAVGDFLSTYTAAGIAQKAAAGDMVFAIALEAYTANDSSGVIDALLISPRLI